MHRTAVPRHLIATTTLGLLLALAPGVAHAGGTGSIGSAADANAP